ncbi:hypothetical protein NUM3379_41450 [Kineococcus sp. NUM-3379]
MRITPGQASARVHAGLGRTPQDALEASVVLEAWGGIVARASLPLTHRAPLGRGTPAPAGLRPVPVGEVSPVPVLEVLGLVATLVATTAWMAPLADALGTEVTERAWRLALPVSFAVQWLLRRRYLTTPAGMGLLRADRPVLLAAAAAAATVPAGMLLAPAVFLPGALLVTWVGGTLVVVRGWGLPYGAALGVAAWAVGAGVPAVWDVTAVVLLTGGAVVAALLTGPVPAGAPTPWGRSLGAAGVGGLTALLLVCDPTVRWTGTSPFPVLALLPSLLGGLWAGRRMDRVWTVLVAALATTSLQDGPPGRGRRVFAGIVAGAVTRLLVGTALPSLVLLAALGGSRPGSSAEPALLLLALGCFGVVAFLTTLLESFSRPGAAAVVAAGSVAASLALVSAFPAGPPVPALAGAALAAAALAARPLARLVHRPERTLATMV